MYATEYTHEAEEQWSLIIYWIPRWHDGRAYARPIMISTSLFVPPGEALEIHQSIMEYGRMVDELGRSAPDGDEVRQRMEQAVYGWMRQSTEPVQDNLDEA